MRQITAHQVIWESYQNTDIELLLPDDHKVICINFKKTQDNYEYTNHTTDILIEQTVGVANLHKYRLFRFHDEIPDGYQHVMTVPSPGALMCPYISLYKKDEVAMPTEHPLTTVQQRLLNVANRLIEADLVVDEQNLVSMSGYSIGTVRASAILDKYKVSEEITRKIVLAGAELCKTMRGINLFDLMEITGLDKHTIIQSQAFKFNL